MSCSCSCFIPCYIPFSKVSLSSISCTRFNARVSCYRGKAEKQTACRIRNLYASSFAISSGLQGQQLSKALLAGDRVTAAPYISVPEARLHISVRAFHSFCVHLPYTSHVMLLPNVRIRRWQMQGGREFSPRFSFQKGLGQKVGHTLQPHIM